jgi:hypothetical protein
MLLMGGSVWHISSSWKLGQRCVSGVSLRRKIIFYTRWRRNCFFSMTCWLDLMICNGTVPTTEQILFLNHARGLVDHLLYYAVLGDCTDYRARFRFKIMLRDWSTSSYAVLGDCADHQACLYSQLRSENHQLLPILCSGFALITLRPWLEELFFSVTYEVDSYRWAILIFKTLIRGSYFAFQQARGLHRYDASGDASQYWNFYVDSFFLDPSTTCLHHLLPGSRTKWAHFTLRWICLLFESLYFSNSKVGTLHQETILFSQEHHALFWQPTSSVKDCLLYWSKKFKMVCRITIHSARRLAVGV